MLWRFLLRERGGVQYALLSLASLHSSIVVLEKLTAYLAAIAPVAFGFSLTRGDSLMSCWDRPTRPWGDGNGQKGVWVFVAQCTL